MPNRLVRNARSRCVIALIVTLFACGWALQELSASQTTTWEMAGARDFLKGRARGVAITWDGLLQPGLRRSEVAAPEQPVIWSALRAPDGTLYLGTGHRGAVYALRPGGELELLWSAPEPAVFAMALGNDGALYVATSPNGRIYRIQGERAVEYFNPNATYIWSLAQDSAGALYAGTGPEGQVFRIPAEGDGEVYYASGQSHITSLAFDREGKLLAGSEPNGLLYRILEKDRAFVLYDASLPEIRAIVPAESGDIYVAAMGGSVARRQQMPASSGSGGTQATPTISTTVTVTASSGNANGADTELQQPAQLPQTGGADASAVTIPPFSASSAIYEMPGIERAAVYRIAPDHTVETLWTSKEENVYDLVLDGNRLLVATDKEGRVYSLDLQGRANLLAQTAQGQTTRLLPGDGHFLAATGNEGKVFRFDSNGAEAAEYESPVHDADRISRWGEVSWRQRSVASVAAGTPAAGDSAGAIQILTRSGNAFRPDDTWSDWEALQSDGDIQRVASPNARYLQWKVRFSPGSPNVALERVTVAYLPQNSAPKITSVKVSSQLKAAENAGRAAAQAAASAATAAYSITVSADGGDDDSSGPAGSTIASTTRLVEPTVVCEWQAEDPDGDTMVYQLAYRAEDETEWKPLARDLKEPKFAADSSRFADGRYYFRVQASDSPDNPAGMARTDELVSAPAIIDHGPPRITILGQERLDDRWQIRVRAEDAVSIVRGMEMSVNAKPFVMVLPEDGISDGRREDYLLIISDDASDSAEKSVLLRATDAAGNVGTARLVLRSANQ
jgi:hypothetical protein